MADSKFETTQFKSGGLLALRGVTPSFFKAPEIEALGEKGLRVKTRAFGHSTFPDPDAPDGKRKSPTLWFEGTEKKLTLSNYRLNHLEDVLRAEGIDPNDADAVDTALNGGLEMILIYGREWPSGNKKYSGIGIVPVTTVADEIHGGN